MTRARFEAMAQAYGGEAARWPADERDAAALLMSSEPDFAREVLAKAAVLDAALDAFRSPPLPSSLRDEVLATAPKAPRWAWLSPAAVAAGLAAACAAGVIVGVVISDRSAASSGAEQVAASTLSLEPSFDLEGA
jgi:hypothetical protein